MIDNRHFNNYMKETRLETVLGKYKAEAETVVIEKPNFYMYKLQA